MKRFYSVIATAILALVAMTASAQVNSDMRVADQLNIASKQQSSTMMRPVSTVKNLTSTPAKAAETVTAADVAGEYVWSFISYLSNNQGQNTGTMMVNAVDETTLEFVGFYSSFPVTATLASDGTITFEKQVMFYNTYYNEDIYFMLYQWGPGYQGVFPSDEPIVASYSNGQITFNEDDLIAVALVGQGYFLLGDSNLMTKVAEEEDDSANWEVCGTADLMDGWILTCYDVDQTAPENIIKDIVVEKSLVEEGVYRLVNPYMGEMYADVNTTQEEKGYIKFNIADPEYPYLYNKVKAGFANSNGEFYNYDLNGYYACIKGYDKEEILANVDKSDLSSYDPATGVLSIPTAVFGITSNPNAAYSWQDNEGNPVDMTSSIKLNFVKVVQTKDITIDFTTQGYENTEVVEGIDEDGIIVVFDQGESNTATAWYNSGSAVRFYHGNVMSIEADDPTYAAIKSIKFVGATGSYKLNAEWSDGEYDSATSTWTGDALAITATQLGTSGHARIKSMVITVEIAEEPAAPELLYTTDAEIVEDEEMGAAFFGATSILAPQTGIKTEVYDDNTIIVRGWGGTEGYDIKVAYDEDENVTSLTNIVNGQETSYDSGYAYLYYAPGKYFPVYLYEGFNYAGEEDGEGYVFLFGFDTSGNYKYYYLSWPELTTGVKAVATDNAKVQKVLENGQIVIVRDGVKYNVAGAMLK